MNKFMNSIKTRVKKSLPYIGISFIIYICFGLAIPTLPVGATAPAPPDTITIPTAEVFQNIYQPGDILIIFEHNIGYTTTPVPNYVASDLFYTRLMDTNGTTILTTTPKPLLNYQYNMSAFYFTAADVTSLGLVWGHAYYVEIDGTNLFSPLLTPVQYQLDPTKWITGTNAASCGYVQSYLINRVVLNLQQHNGIQYISSSSNGAILNTNGRNLVLSAIPYLDTPIPQLFQLSTQQISVTQPVATGGLQTNLTLTNQLGTALATSFTNFGTLLHISGQQVAMGWILLCCLIVISIVFLATGNIVGASICSLPMVLIGVWIGAIPVAFVFVAVMIIVVLLAFYLFIRGM
jgi:hypothetical protein